MLTPSREEMISKIRERAIANDPSIVELKMGCGLLVGWEYRTVLGVQENGDPIVSLFGGIASKGTYTIIGRPLTLADILLAISEKEMFRASQRLMTVSGCFYDNGLLLAQWNLRLPFEEQSDKVLLFIHGLVK